MRYKGLQQRIYQMLQTIPLSRERRHKNTYLIRLLTETWTHQVIPTETTLVNLAKDFTSADRFWRLLLADEGNKDLRGVDYHDGKALAQKKMLELGVEVGFDRDTLLGKKLSTGKV